MIRPLLPLALVLTAACHVELHDGQAQVFATYEQEPNDYAWNANDLGWLAAGDVWYIDGDWCDPACDPFDGFAFQAGGPLVIDAVLRLENYTGEAALCVFDPALNAFVLCAQAAGPEVALSFGLTGPSYDFHLVSQPLWGAAHYQLELRAYSAYFQTQALEAVEVPAARRAYYERTVVQAPQPVFELAQLLLVDAQGELELGPLVAVDAAGNFQPLDQ